MNANSVKKELKQYIQNEKVEIFERFFKTGPGEYGEGDKFLGISVPNQRIVSKKFKDLPLSEIQNLLDSRYHEERLTGLLILVLKFQKAEEKSQKQIVSFYKKNFKAVNNWDLVDSTAHKILGPYLIDKDKSELMKWAKSKDLWTRRIAIMTTFYFIGKGQFKDTLEISDILLQDKEDLIHKAVGWMLREIGKRDLKVEEDFLRTRYQEMPRTMLRYAIEKFPEKRRKQYLLGEVS